MTDIYHTVEEMSKPTIRQMQLQHDDWARHNFPMQYDNPHQPALGICEEAGELAHAVLKWQQNIRGTAEEHFEEMKDALADTFVYMMSFANVMGWDLQDIITSVWEKVKQRDWVKFPRDGVSA
jgi:NTP pyrophosphatase (non-canonical NTP hydrolase)